MIGVSCNTDMGIESRSVAKTLQKFVNIHQLLLFIIFHWNLHEINGYYKELSGFLL